MLSMSMMLFGNSQSYSHALENLKNFENFENFENLLNKVIQKESVNTSIVRFVAKSALKNDINENFISGIYTLPLTYAQRVRLAKSIYNAY